VRLRSERGGHGQREQPATEMELSHRSPLPGAGECRDLYDSAKWPLPTGVGGGVARPLVSCHLPNCLT
jgi:hypothetical protein